MDPAPQGVEGWIEHHYCLGPSFLGSPKSPILLSLPRSPGKEQSSLESSRLNTSPYSCPILSQWTQLRIRKENLTRLFEKMQAYQYEQISADPDKPLADGIRALDTTDMERQYMQDLFHDKKPSDQRQALRSSITLQNSQHRAHPIEIQFVNTSKVTFLTGKFILFILV